MAIKVVHLITELTLGGAQINTLLNFCHLDRRRFEPYLIYGRCQHLEVKCDSRQFEISALKRRILPWNDLAAIYKLFRILQKIEPEIVHTHSFKAGILGRIAARLAGVKIIVHTYHGFSFSPFSHWLKKTVFVLVERFVNCFTDGLILVAEDDLRSGIAQKLFSPEKARLIYSGFDFTPFEKTYLREDVCRKYGIDPSRFICGVIAPFKPQKNLLFLIDVAAQVVARHPEVIFVIAGDGTLRKKIEKRIKHYRLENNFLLPGFIVEIAPLISVFDLGVSAALWEGLPQSLVQFRLMKKAVVASDISGNREVIFNQKNGLLVSPLNREAFAEAISKLAENDQLRRQYANFNDDLQPWRYQRMVSQTEEFYLQLKMKKDESALFFG